MTDIAKFTDLLDDPEIRLLIFALAHSGHDLVPENPGAGRLRALAFRTLAGVDSGQRQSWLSTDAHKLPMAVVQVRAILGEQVLTEVGAYVRTEAESVAWQLAAVLPDLIDAMSPDGTLLSAPELAERIRLASALDDRMAGVFAPHVF